MDVAILYLIVLMDIWCFREQLGKLLQTLYWFKQLKGIGYILLVSLPR